MRIARTLVVIWCCLALCACAKAQTSPRQRVLMDFGWRFANGDPAEVGTLLDFPEVSDLAKTKKADLAAAKELEAKQVDAAATHLGEKLAIVQADFSDAQWRRIDLPHDWAVELPFDPKSNYGHGFKGIHAGNGTNIGWYRRTFDLPAGDKGKAIWLEFDGVYRNSLVWLNGHCLGRHASGYSSFIYDVSKYANFGGKNTLVVRADATRVEGWFYEGAGIYRHVWLVKTDPVHVAHWGTYVACKVDGGNANLSMQTRVRNDGDKSATVSLTSRIVDANGANIAEIDVGGITIEPRQEQPVEQKIVVKDAHLWSPETPYLYKMVSTIKRGDAAVDVYETPFGVRTLEFTADKGFFLNGKRVAIKGTCNHQDHAGVGAALPDRLQEFRIERLKEMGSNAYRTSHNPPTPELLDACDRLGMLVMDETRRMGSDAEAMGQLESMLRRDRNHPSVFIWSIGNEEGQIQGDDEIGVAICRSMQDLAHKLDPSRQCTVAMNGAWGKGFSNVIDVQGFNYGAPGPKRDGKAIDAFHEKFPDKPCVGSEVASTLCTRGIYADDAERGYVNAYDRRAPNWGSTAESWWSFFAAREWLAGGFVWTGFDYRGEPTPYKWPCVNSHFGIMDTCGFAKDNFYYYQSWWGDKPVLHLFPHWNWVGKEGQQIEVWVHSNCDEVELFLNGATQGRKRVEPMKHLEWKVKYEPGVLLAKGFRADGKTMEDNVETSGEAAAVVLHADRTRVRADGMDVSVVTVSVADAKGRAVPTADNEITFSFTGPGKIIGVGNGDPSSHEADKAEKRHLFNGLAQVIVQSTREAGKIELKASGGGLKGSSVSISSGGL